MVYDMTVWTTRLKRRQTWTTLQKLVMNFRPKLIVSLRCCNNKMFILVNVERVIDSFKCKFLWGCLSLDDPPSMT